MKYFFIPNKSKVVRVPQDIAVEIGFNEATLLLQIDFLLSISQHEHDGSKWIYHTASSLRDEEFPYWSVSKINRMLNKLVDKELLIITEKYNVLDKWHKDKKHRWITTNPAGCEKLKNLIYAEHPEKRKPEKPPKPKKKPGKKKGLREDGSNQNDLVSNQNDLVSNQNDSLYNTENYSETYPEKTTTKGGKQKSSQSDKQKVVVVSSDDLKSIQEVMPFELPENKHRWIANKVKKHGLDRVFDGLAYTLDRMNKPKPPKDYWTYLGVSIDDNYGPGYYQEWKQNQAEKEQAAIQATKQQAIKNAEQIKLDIEAAEQDAKNQRAYTFFDNLPESEQQALKDEFLPILRGMGRQISFNSLRKRSANKSLYNPDMLEWVVGRMEKGELK